MNKRRSATSLFATGLPGLVLAGAATFSVAEPAFEPEPLGQVNTLPTPYPSHWILVLDSAFMHMTEGKVVVLDPLAKGVANQNKGMYTASFMATIAQSKKRNEHYVAETFHSRGGRGGERTDVVAIYDPATLSVTAEVEVPAKRVGAMPKRIAMNLTKDERFLLIYNFTPAQSVSVVDLDSREFVGEVNTPGCAFVVPTGKRGFSAICSNGAFYSVQLDKHGKTASTERTAAVIDTDDDPIFEAYGSAGDTAYFPTFLGNVLPVKLSGAVAEPKESWSLVSEDEREAGWRPGGNIPITQDKNGALYVLMHPEGTDGTHKNGGGDVWVYNAKDKTRVNKIELKNWGISLGMTGGEGQQLLTVVNGDLGVDIYDANTGAYLNAIEASTETTFRVDGIN